MKVRIFCVCLFVSLAIAKKIYRTKMPANVVTDRDKSESIRREKLRTVILNRNIA